MNINELITIVKNKLQKEIMIQDLKIEDKSFLHKNHKQNQEGRYHLKLTIKSNELAQLSKIESTKKINLILLKKIGTSIHKLEFNEKRITTFLQKELIQ